MTLVREDAIFIGANKQASIMDYSAADQLIAVGASNTVALYHPLSSKGIFQTFKNHTKDVTGVKFVNNGEYLVSISEDHLTNIYKKTESSYTLLSSLDSHTQSITCLAVAENTVVTGSADGNVIIHSISNDTVTLAHTFQVKQNFFPLAIAIQSVDENGNFILAISGTNNNIYIYNYNSVTSAINQSAILTGHEDWIKCLSFVCDVPNKSYILASGSQDRYIRLWRLNLGDLTEDDNDENKLILLSNKKHKFQLLETSTNASLSFEAMIVGHDDWVTGLQWNPTKLQLLSSSADTALMVWEMDKESGIWCCINRLGEMSIKGASTATGASGGFWSCIWFIDPKTDLHYILANGKTGSIRVYKSTDKDAKSFESVLGVTGANKEITDIVWSKDGKSFFATSLDQTTRLYSQWNKTGTWHEFARPQIHGYDMICLDTLSETKFVSGGDEKVLRVFEMTNSISKLLGNLCDIDINEVLPESASLPVLGLSNKAANEQMEAGEAAEADNEKDDDEKVDTAKEKDDVIETLTTPPLEDHLQRYTLFPEIEKLYGHGYEITCVATNPNGTLIASACRSNTAKHAVIRIFNASNEYQLCSKVLEGHNLSITSMEFSADGNYLISVSRDRQFSLWKITDESKGEFELVEINTKAHSRIVWDCSWAGMDSSRFFTVSRDKNIKLWSIGEKGVEVVASMKFDEPVTSVSTYNTKIDEKLLVSVGFESGNVYLLKVGEEIEILKKFAEEIIPGGRVSKLSFSQREDCVYLSVGSVDTSVRVYSITV